MKVKTVEFRDYEVEFRKDSRTERVLIENFRLPEFRFKIKLIIVFPEFYDWQGMLRVIRHHVQKRF